MESSSSSSSRRRSRWTPVEIEMSEKEEARLRQRLARLQESPKVLRLCGLRIAPGSKKVLLLTDTQVRNLRKGHRFVRFGARQLLANKSHGGGFLVSLLSALVAGVSTALVEAAVGGNLDDVVGTSSSSSSAKTGDGLFLNKYDQLFLRRNNHLARVNSTRGGSGLHLVPPTEKERCIADTHHSGEGLFLIYGNSVFTPTECVEDHIFKILL